MSQLGDLLQTDDWKREKHVPIIHVPDSIPDDDFFDVKVTLGEGVAHPNTTEHHIRWITLFFQPEGDAKTYQVAHFSFDAHGESTEGANQGPLYTHHSGATQMKTGVGGTLHAMSFCNIHGLWESTRKIELG